MSAIFVRFFLSVQTSFKCIVSAKSSNLSLIHFGTCSSIKFYSSSFVNSTNAIEYMEFTFRSFFKHLKISLDISLLTIYLISLDFNLTFFICIIVFLINNYILSTAGWLLLLLNMTWQYCVIFLLLVRFSLVIYLFQIFFLMPF